MPQFNSHKILVIDDEVEFCRILVDFLTCEGFQVESANDGEEGLLKAEKSVPDLVLLDIRMPKKGGIYFLENFSRISETPVIAVEVT
jgi:DNA-binding response OmpR family regulator